MSTSLRCRLGLVLHNDNGRESPIPITLRCLLDKIRGLQLDRSPITLAGTLPQIKETGMSPKKAHEVSRMTAYILQMIRVNNWDLSVLRIVDVGAGQVCDVPHS